MSLTFDFKLDLNFGVAVGLMFRHVLVFGAQLGLGLCLNFWFEFVFGFGFASLV